MPDPKIIRSRPAGPDHAVISVDGAGRRQRGAPCADCPWRVDAVGVFPAEAFRHSADTATDGSRVTADTINEASHTFGCHRSGARKPATCAGYVLRGMGGIGWRIAAALGRIDPAGSRDGGVDLFKDYFEMAVANGVPPDDPALDACRPWTPRTRNPS